MPNATVAAIIAQMDRNGEKILLTRRNVEPFKGQWCLPGGHIDPYEPAETAVIREVREETGLAYQARFYGYFDEILKGREIHHVVLVFAGTGTGELNPEEQEVSETGWFSMAECQSFELAFKHNEILEAYARDPSAAEKA